MYNIMASRDERVVKRDAVKRVSEKLNALDTKVKKYIQHETKLYNSGAIKAVIDKIVDEYINSINNLYNDFIDEANNYVDTYGRNDPFVKQIEQKANTIMRNVVLEFRERRIILRNIRRNNNNNNNNGNNNNGNNNNGNNGNNGNGALGGARRRTYRRRRNNRKTVRR